MLSLLAGHSESLHTLQSSVPRVWASPRARAANSLCWVRKMAWDSQRCQAVNGVTVHLLGADLAKGFLCRSSVSVRV